MADDLADHKARIGYCWGEIDALENAIDAFITSGSYRITHEVDEATGDGIFYVQLARQIPKQIAIKTGSIAHELRATLDALACTLALRNAKTTNQVYFPICADEAEFLDPKRGREKIKKLSQQNQEAIAALRPWQAESPLLHALHLSDRTHKHTRLIVIGSDTGQVGLGFNSNGFVRFLKARVEINDHPEAFMRIGKGSYMEVTIGADVTMSEPDSIRSRPVATVLREFASLTKSIVERFD